MERITGKPYKRFATARRRLAGVEAVAMLTKGQVRAVPANDISAQRAFVHQIFGVATIVLCSVNREPPPPPRNHASCGSLHPKTPVYTLMEWCDKLEGALRCNDADSRRKGGDHDED